MLTVKSNLTSVTVCSEVGSMKTGDYMIHVSTAAHSLPMLIVSLLVYRSISSVERTSKAMTGK